jgi:ATP-binding cassette subfamily B protein
MIIPRGETTLVTGKSGSGKSTLAALVQHLYPVDGGTITINGIDTSNYTLHSIRKMMGAVPQQINFLSGSILENLAPGEATPDHQRILGLIRATGLLPLINSLPGGLGHHLAEGGRNLSGGERQRLALVRALYRDPMLLILDEPSASLDPRSEYYINRLLLGLKEQSQTMLLITHKKQYEALADRIYRLEDGSTRLVPHREEALHVP